MKNTLYIWFLLMCIQLYSQTTKPINVDSLIKLNKAGELPPEGRILLYNELFKDYLLTNKQVAQKYNDSIYLVAIKYKLKSGLGDYYLNTGINCFTKLDYDSGLKYSRKACEKYFEDGNIGDYLNGISKQCLYLRCLNRREESYQLAIKNINLYKNKSVLSGLGDLYLEVAEYYFNKNKNNNAIINTKSALYFYWKTKDYAGIAECDVLMAEILGKLEKYNEAIIYLERLIDLPEEIRKNETYNYVYLAYMVKYLNKSNKYSESIKFANKAILNFQKAKLVVYELEMQLYKADALQKLGKIETASTLLKSIEKNFSKIIDEPEFESKITFVNEIKSNIFYSKKLYKLALETLQKNLKYKDVELNTFEKISKIQYQLKRYKEAFENLQLFNKKKIEQLTNNQKNNLVELQLLYKTKDSEFIIQELNFKKTKYQLHLKKANDFSIKIIVALVFLLLLLIFLYYNFRVKKKVGQILRYKNNKLEKINTLLNKSNKDKEVLLKEIHHRVKNNLQLVSSILYMQANDVPDISVSDFLDECQNRISSIALIHQNLYLNNNLDRVDFHQYLEDLSTSIMSSFSGRKKVVFEINANNSNFNIHTAISLGLIISELSCNSIKHAFKDNAYGIIFLEINKIDDTKFELIAGDNGCGNLSLFSSSNSMGLELIRLLVMQLNGEIEKINRQGSFCKITFEEIEN